jgi:hypothetical protein
MMMKSISDDCQHLEINVKKGRCAVDTVTICLPENLYKGAAFLAKEGWFRDEEEVIFEAVRRFIDAYQPEILEEQINSDVEWGLHGED